MRTQKYKATTRSARCNHCPFSKWVRAKVSRSPQNLTSAVFNGTEGGSAAAARGRKRWRAATNWLGTLAAKWAVLSLFCI